MNRFQLKPVAVALLALVLLACGATLLSPATQAADDKKPAGPKPALTVSTVRPQSTSMPIRLAANGNIAAWQEAIIGSESNGLRLADVLVNVGDQVRAGQVLATFANESVAADVAQARAALMEAEANAAEAAANAARARTLQSTGALSEQQINQYLTAEQTQKAKVEAAKATLSAQQLRLKKVQVLAPDSGIISARAATVGAVVPTGTELFRMIRKGRLEWRAEVTSSELGRIKTGMPASIVAVNGAELKGKVRMVGPTVDPQNRAAIVYVDLAPANENTPPARAGMFARGEFDLGTSSALTVPQQAVVLRDGFNYVFSLTPDNRVQQLKVKTGRRIGDRVEVLEGLKPDTAVVVSGAGFLNDGDLVRLASDSNGAPAAK
ncbi:efflux RND transporter periplasmic adaptor subunit [Noviherbaspirillum denitrificans]|uniref:Efflux transporter periplasmic adaptor subunit n=1 Tax=Noviherbaspirillum denitrificans TaxID=1968433 RepID=A0A254TFV0_9BURK|nr:efflux RND transporter periplasmic adaptor subunit [Noviherbaspirillum denitrificans]OWW21526.1 efflux transporter periplasmic adaptor subunit [Noviherbaspirillum denitrificans]